MHGQSDFPRQASFDGDSASVHTPPPGRRTRSRRKSLPDLVALATSDAEILASKMAAAKSALGTEVAAPVVPAETESPTNTFAEPLPVRAKAAGVSRQHVVMGLLALVNIGVIAALVTIRIENRQMREPVAELSVEVGRLSVEQADMRGHLDATRATLDESRAKVDETRAKVDRQAGVLATTVETVAANAQHQTELENEAKEREAREARAIASMDGRLNHVEKRVRDAYSLSEALSLIDAEQGKPVTGSHAKVTAYGGKLSLPH